jgi:hypothetical protein
MGVQFNRYITEDLSEKEAVLSRMTLTRKR